MAQKSAQVRKGGRTVKKTAADDTKRYFSILLNSVATVYLAITAIVLPLYMNREKYTAITAAKSDFFFATSIAVFICMILLLTSSYLYSLDSPSAVRQQPERTLKQRVMDSPTLIADASLIAYWVLMLISCLLSDDKRTAFRGLDPRNNGFIYQTVYTAAYFIISRMMKPVKWKATLFVWGGTALAIPCIFHYYGVDLYDVVHYSAYKNGKWVDGVLADSYTGPFWDSTTYRFLGPVGNVNLGSYILCITLVIAAGLYITGSMPDFFYPRSRYTKPDEKGKREKRSIIGSVCDRHGISLIVCFMIILFAELNINTDAGLVALAAAVVAIPIALCGSLDRLFRTLVVFAAAAVTVLADLTIDTVLRKDELGTTFMLLCVMIVFFAIAAAVVWKLKKKESVQRFATAKRLRTAMCAIMGLAVIGGISLSLIITQPDDAAAGPLSGATETLSERDLKEKSDTIIHELGQMLRGNFDDRFGHNRLFTWKRTLSLVKHNPVFGIGPDNFRRFFALHYKEEAQKMFPDSNGNLDKAHNEFLDVLLDNGIAGLLTYLGFFGALLWACFRNADRNKIAPVFGVAVISYMAHALFGYQLPIQSPVMWIMIGAAGAFARGENSASETVAEVR
ncbi:MAG: O-antigen ligase family protein [Ruminococcaceae bacterium]|nr:O-antigen ligase family protein [Oscillospiraceae bacterium]